MQKNRHKIQNNISEIREHKVTIRLSDKELKIIDDYARKHRKSSRAATIRESAVRYVMGRLVEDYPSLFD
ncbi:MAG: hypothetical protein J6Y72_11305 [Bacteroidales bacterium]|jgi:hypothetical protein|nr:hypothetical protein [Bacteroidales bacterium]MBP5420383.1 hypothetical protein [Bacteroidales bacterium]MCR5697917.1 ribbon-helix-helix domain-containing protein [Marinilabiliaceae bacterium]